MKGFTIKSVLLSFNRFCLSKHGRSSGSSLFAKVHESPVYMGISQTDIYKIRLKLCKILIKVLNQLNQSIKLTKIVLNLKEAL